MSNKDKNLKTRCLFFDMMFYMVLISANIFIIYFLYVFIVNTSKFQPTDYVYGILGFVMLASSASLSSTQECKEFEARMKEENKAKEELEKAEENAKKQSRDIG
jgi:5-bromo-4-chloroindolyl phosphate hydrolysis protein